ncbi:hypothetical protein [Streptomyces rhizosphaerihabitans]|uniref:hypothetical protein n=1 Tax=Streptomyces rhizosphaerihabitans TaxID=1266770 RepID=UPI0021BFF83A|nr:hypothetical protein [Streptomyces rhizosphaerihabitans]MCT9010546.1 hypothetical protein [Streptomyces rhizosphaerihabitans]
MNHHDTAQDEPDEHVRFWAYLSELEQVTEADEATRSAKSSPTQSRRWPSPPSCDT